jgi:hypothetical protein
VKSLQVVHPSFGVYVGVLVAALVVIAGLAAASPGVKGHLPRLGKCAIAGVAAATALVVYVDRKHHAQLVASAARPAGGHRLSVAYILADGFAFTALVVTVVLFAVVTLAARGRRRRRAPQAFAWQPGPPGTARARRHPASSRTGSPQ